MSLESALNVLWLLLAASALVGTVRSTCRRSPARKQALSGLRVIGAVVIVAALFPYISATDDLVRIEQFHHQHHHADSPRRGAHDDLIRLYQTIDTPLVPKVERVVLILFFLALVPVLTTLRLSRTAPFAIGRSPPLPAPV